MKTVIEISTHFGVSEQSIRNWIKDGLKVSWKKEIGRKPYILIDPKDVEEYHRKKGSE